MIGENVSVRLKENLGLQVEEIEVYSEYLERDVKADVYLPSALDVDNVSLLLINDGQDVRKMNFGNTIYRLVSTSAVEPLLCVAIHCGADRINEYGTTYCADYMGRGNKAGLYTKFIFDELLPFIQSHLNVIVKEKSFAGFSLGGLSALDIVWNNPHEFSKVGVFSGSLWWRRRGYEDEGYNYDKDRLMHLQVQNGRHFSWLKFFFECGQLDETADRNNNGIIDSIEDTTDLVAHLKVIGYSDEQVHYLELEDGEHNVETWARAFPVFLRWGWGRSNQSTSR